MRTRFLSEHSAAINDVLPWIFSKNPRLSAFIVNIVTKDMLSVVSTANYFVQEGHNEHFGLQK